MPDPTPPSALSWHPPQRLLEIAELVLTGALPVAPGIVEVTPEVQQRLLAGETVTLEDAEGTPVAGLSRKVAGGEGETELPLPEFVPQRAFSHGPVRAARRAPAQVRAELEPDQVLAVAVTGLLTAAQVEEVRAQAERTGHRLLWLAVFGAGRTSPLPPDGLWRAVRDVAGEQDQAVPVAVPWLAHTEDAALLTAVARGFGAHEVLTSLSPRESAREGELHPAFAREHARAVPPAHRRGLTVFFTGLSGSGKSTVAKALAERLLDRTTRTVSLLDGDEVRRMLSAGLTFSRADRDLNIRRIGYVAAEISRHGGLAICAPIAPFDSVRAEVRAGVEQVGDFVLVHISTPLQECERRDRKGLYARARRGEIPDFTGISSPYEIPADAELRIDTTGIPIEAAVDEVWALLGERGYLSGPQ